MKRDRDAEEDGELVDRRGCRGAARAGARARGDRLRGQLRDPAADERELADSGERVAGRLGRRPALTTVRLSVRSAATS